MSEVIDDYRKRNIDWKLKLSTEAPLSYVNRQVDLRDKILLSVEIPWPLLQLWNTLIKGTSGNKYVNYIDLLNSRLNSTVTDGCFAIRRDCKRMEDLFINNAVMSKLCR